MIDQYRIQWIVFWISTGFALLLGGVLIVSSGGSSGEEHWAFRPPTAYFLLVTALFFVGNALLSGYQLFEYAGFRQACNRYLDDDRLSEIAESVRSSTASVPAERQAIESIKGLLDDDRVDAGPVLLPLRHRLIGIRDAVQAGWEDPVTIRTNLDRLSQRLEEPPALRFINQTFVNILLFTGIIGTFYGLVQLVSSETMYSLLDAFRDSGALRTAELGDLFLGFETAFGSSLVAYLSYIVGRMTLDLTDEAFDATASFTVARVQDGLARAFSYGKILAHVDLDPESKRLLRDNVAELRSLVESSATLNQSLAELLPQLGSAATTLRQAMEDAEALTRQISASVESAKSDWQAASDSFSATTERFFGTTERFIGKADELLQSIATSSTTMTQSATELKDSVALIREVWQQNMSALAAQLSIAVNEFTANLNHFSSSWAHQVEDYERTKHTLSEIAAQTGSGRERLILSIDQLQQLLRQGGEQTRSALEQLTSHSQANSIQMIHDLDIVATKMERASDGFEKLQGFMGIKSGESLDTVMRAIEVALNQQNEVLTDLHHSLESGSITIDPR